MNFNAFKQILVLIVALGLSGMLQAQDPGTGSGAGTRTGTGGINAQDQRDKPHVVLVSIDGARWDYPGFPEASALRKIADQGVRAERLLPVYPTLTFPNHYSIVTGLYPAHHGITANDFPLDDEGNWYYIRNREQVQNGKNYRGEPTWVTAELQGMVSASFFWVGSEADVMGVQPTHWRLFDNSVAPSTRVDQVLSWLSEPAESRPHFITLYFEEVDDHSHWSGAASMEGNAALARIDHEMQRLIEGIDALPIADQVNLIVVSDHGQGNYKLPYEPFSLEGRIDLSDVEAVDGGSYVSLWLDDPQQAAEIVAQVNQDWSYGTAWLKEHAPAAWMVRDDPRFPDIIMVADAGYSIISSEDKAGNYHPGDHGWRPEADVMHGIFLARGPAFKTGLEVGPIHNVDINPLMLHILGLNPPPMDGELARIRHILKGDPAGE